METSSGVIFEVLSSFGFNKSWTMASCSCERFFDRKSLWAVAVCSGDSLSIVVSLLVGSWWRERAWDMFLGISFFKKIFHLHTKIYLGSCKAGSICFFVIFGFYLFRALRAFAIFAPFVIGSTFKAHYSVSVSKLFHGFCQKWMFCVPFLVKCVTHIVEQFWSLIVV